MGRFTRCISFNIFCINILFVSAVTKDTCERCVKVEECPSFEHLNKNEQLVWIEQHPCEEQLQLSTIDQGDYVCCPLTWGTDNSDINQLVNDNKNKRSLTPGEIRPNNAVWRNQQGIPQSGPQYQVSYPDQNYYNNNQQSGPNYGSNNPNYQVQNPNYQNVYGQDPNYFPLPRTSGNFWRNPWQPGVIVNPGQIQNPWQNPNPQNPFGTGNGNSFSRPNLEDQCAAQTDLLPDPSSQCCGRDMSDAEKIIDLQNFLNINAPSNGRGVPTQRPPAPQQRQLFPSWYLYLQKQKDSTNNDTVDVVFDDRIAGGKETELDQFPWTVLLKATFADNNRQESFICGGSLISRKYVLTAGHCVFEQGKRLVGIEITLAEYDKTTFPRDCKSEIGKATKCVDNVLMVAEKVTLHPQYDDNYLHNDIALIRLQGYAPYTRYIRPICLPPFDIDNNNLANLPLAVAGWGRNGEYQTDVKQSTVVRLVPHEACKTSYPRLSDSHLCAAGRTGEDTCKGDSGGPLMMLYKDSYYVIGVVSGKRSDSPCGTSVPSLYTNVFRYIPWIRSVISNN